MTDHVIEITPECVKDNPGCVSDLASLANDVTMSLPDLKPHALAVAEARARQRVVKARFDAAMDGFLYAIRSLVNEKAEADQAVKEAEDAAREAALEHYTLTGFKSLEYGFGVRVNRDIRYQENEALAYLREYAPGLIVQSVDKKLFVAGVRGGTLVGAPVQIVEVPAATIPSSIPIAFDDCVCPANSDNSGPEHHEQCPRYCPF